MRLIASQSGQQGMSLIELMVAITILAIVTVLALPSYGVWINNTKIRTTAESILAGLQLARNEAVRRNAIVRFQFVDNFTNTCALSSTAGSWIVSLDDPAGKCDIAPSDTAAPRIVQSKPAAEGAAGVTTAATDSTTAASTTVAFNGLGRVTSSTQIARIDLDSSVLAASDSRDLRIMVTPGGQIRMCDPNVSSASDPRHC